MRQYVSSAVGSNMHFIMYRYCCKGRYSVNINLKCWQKVDEFDHDWRVAALNGSLLACLLALVWQLLSSALCYIMTVQCVHCYCYWHLVTS